MGFIGAWQFDELFYIEHLAICESQRGIGYGSKILVAFCQQHKQVILEIDPVVDDVSKKRLYFYQHNGFYSNNMVHYHPSYHNEMLPHGLTVLSYPEKLTDKNYQIFNRFLIQQVMHKDIL